MTNRVISQFRRCEGKTIVKSYPYPDENGSLVRLQLNDGSWIVFEPHECGYIPELAAKYLEAARTPGVVPQTSCLFD